MKNKLLLIIIAVLGTIFGWIITDSFIIALSIYQFLAIELIITVFHELYNLAKIDIINKS